MPVSDDMLRWKAVIKGQPGTCWEGGDFHFAIEFPQGYPFKPVKLWLETRMYHPNVCCSVQPPDHTTTDHHGDDDVRGGTEASIDPPLMNFASGMLRRWSPAHTLRKGECATDHEKEGVARFNSTILYTLTRGWCLLNACSPDGSLPYNSQP